ncbi:unnamed protein product [Paramecium pentaurelia]|uniref:Uncharacterized protein n=1 Tax=Paramecium pentaurelia TaxID=43138 RepID=A0A8S1TUL1_9CILI|nr:unnamed protein product [Paramecium pentaurelia]
MLNNCYTLRHSPVFRNPKSNIAVQQLTTLINETAGRLSPLQPQVKKIIGIKKNSSTDHQLPLCEVPFQTNFFAQHENDLSYSNRSNIQTNRQFSRNQRTQSVYTGNKENFVRSPTRSPFSKPVIQKDCYTPIYKRSPIQRVQSPGIIAGIRQTNQKGFGSISPLRIQQKPNLREPLSEMVDNLKQNILRDIQEVTKKYSNTIIQVNQLPERIKQEHREVKYDDIKAQEFKKQKYLEHQALLLQQQLELIKQQQQKLVVQNKQSFCSQENLINATLDQNKHFQQRQHDLTFLKSLENQNRSQSFVDQQSNFQSLRQDQTQKIKQIQEIKKFTYDPQYQLQVAQQQVEERTPLQNISKYNQQIDYLQRLNNKIESIQKYQHQVPEQKNDEFYKTKKQLDQQVANTIDMNQEKQSCNQFQSPTNYNQEKQYPVFNTTRNGYSPIGNRELLIANKESTINMLNNNKQMLSTLNSQNELQKLKNLQLELMQNKPLFEQPKQSKIEFNFNKSQETGEAKIEKNYFNSFAQTQQFQIEKTSKQEMSQENNQENFNFNKTKITVSNPQQQQKQQFQPQQSKYIQLQNQQEKFSAYQDISKQITQQKLPAYLKGADETDDDVNNQITISNLSSIIPAEISANQNKKINVSFESSIEQQQFDYLKGSDCRNTFGPLQLETILKSPKNNHQVIPERNSPCQPEFDLNSSRQQKQNHNNYQEITYDNEQENQLNSSRQCINNNQSLKKQTRLKNDEVTKEVNVIEQIETMGKIVKSQSQSQSQSRQSRDSKSLENSQKNSKLQNSGSTYKTKSPQNNSTAKQLQVYSPLGTKNSILVQPFQKESPSNRTITKESEKNKNQIKSQQSILENKNCDKISSGQSQRYSDYKDEVNKVDKDKQEQDYSSNNSSRYEQMLQNFQNIKNQSRIEFQQENQTFKQSMQVNECEHISDFVIFSDKQNENQLEIVKKKTVTFNEQLIQQSPLEKEKLQGGTNFCDFMKIKALDILSSDSIPTISQDAFTLTQLQPKGGISFLQYKQQLEN